MSPITLRLCTEADDRGLRWLAERDTSRPLTPGAILAAELDGRLLAALCLREGRVIADPFTRTDELVDLLRLRAAQLRDDRRQAAAREGLRALWSAARGARRPAARPATPPA